MTAADRRARAASLRGRRAGLMSRLLAIAIDVAVVALLTFACFVGFAILQYMFGTGTFSLPGAGPLKSAISYPTVALVYLTASWTVRSQTLGGALVGLRVVRGDGGRVHVFRSLARALICVTIGIPSLAWAVVSRKNAALHDLACRTAVVHDWSWAAAALPSHSI